MDHKTKRPGGSHLRVRKVFRSTMPSRVEWRMREGLFYRSASSKVILLLDGETDRPRDLKLISQRGEPFPVRFDFLTDCSPQS